MTGRRRPSRLAFSFSARAISHAIGESTTLYCSPTSGDPDPAGGSFASGAPAIQTAGNNLGDYVLVAQ